MIETAALTEEFQQRALGAPGAFAWWYADLLDPQGNGLVLIWSVGLPFLPGSRMGVPALDRPSVNVAYYRRGREALYLLQQHEPHRGTPMSVDGSTQIGNSKFVVTRTGRTLALRVELDEPMPHGDERLRASLELTGSAPELPLPSSTAKHVWTPRLLHAAGHATLTLEGRTEQIVGSGYFDGNASWLPLQAQGIDSWRWARFSIDDRCFVVYDVSGAANSTHVLEGSSEGSLRELGVEARFDELGLGRYGIMSPRHFCLDLGADEVIVCATQLLEDGPFYQRFLLEAKLRGRVAVQSRSRVPASATGIGIYEVVYPGRVDVPWQRPFVRMRTHRVGGANSPWLPLFSGWSESRGRRLLASVARRLQETTPRADATSKEGGAS